MRGFVLCVSVLALGGLAAGQISLEQASARRDSDFSPAAEGETVTVQGTVSAKPIQFSFFTHLAIQDDSGHGLVLEGTPAQFAKLKPGNQVEVRGTISKRSGLPVLLPAAIQVLSRGPAPAPQRAGVSALQSFRYLGVLVSTEGRILDKGENTGGEYLRIGDAKKPFLVFLPLAKARTGPPDLVRFEVGDKVRVTGVASQYCPFPPYNRYFQIVISDDDAVVLLSKRWLISPELFTVCLAAFGFAVAVWWMRERRMGAQREMVRTFYSLGEEMIGAGSLAEIVQKLVSALPKVLRVSGIHLYLYNRNAKTLDRVDGGPGLQPVSLAVFSPEGSLPLGAAACFRNQALLTIPDTRRSPFFPDGRGEAQPGSVMFVPMFAEAELVGVLELYQVKPMHDFSRDERVLTQHLANQIALALRLMEEKSIREQLFRSEKLAAAGQLISGVAAELRSPLDNISSLADSMMASPGGWENLRGIFAEARKASEIVARLVSFTQPERAEAKRIELNALLRSLIGFRREACEERGFRIQDQLCPTPIYVLGSQGQLERVFLDLLVQAEQSLAETSEKTLAVSTSVLARRVLVEISYAANPLKTMRGGTQESHENGLPGEGVQRGILRSHGGEIRLVRSPQGECRLEVELPLAPVRVAAVEGTEGARPFTCLVVEPEVDARQQLVGLLTNRGFRVIPASSAEEGAERVQRLRFDVVFCSIRLPGLNWIQFSESIRPQIGGFVLLSEGYDYELSRGLLSAESFVLVQPVDETELDRLLAAVESHLAARQAGPVRLQVVRGEKKAASN